MAGRRQFNSDDDDGAVDFITVACLFSHCEEEVSVSSLLACFGGTSTTIDD